ncbi:hypothetical protein C8A05DRAFT_18735 [Staphylotrichum tortipilum]|uniref:Zn(2)-C6 fungal-type domain-containing protein n=1 Tax=Staphylotrichum tortipilum TaxID=2831512 RepID=A0AAN6RPZ8_9PEZI|nr:hypothetical protein C8A05DRAFT_18735 [Staphylotrichum longicolle]
MKANSLSRTRATDPLPPMPRRQSCDRCHEQKVRCVTEGIDGALILGGISEESEASLQGHVVSSVPCVRCKKAGAVCIYSPVVIPYSAAGMGLGIMSHPPEHVRGHLASQMNPLLMPPATPTYCDILVGSQPGPGPEAPAPLPSQWQAATAYESDSNQFIADICQLSSFSEATPAPSIPCLPIFPDPTPAVPSTTEDMMGGYPWAVPALPDYSLEELAHINLRIHMAGHALPSPFRTLASLSPAIDDVFDAAYSLINVVDRYAARHAAARRSPTPAGPRSAGGYESPSPQQQGLSTIIDTAFDSSICLMIHACHQALLGVFEELSASFLFYLTQPSSTPTSTPPATPLSATFPAPTQTTAANNGNNQAIVMANLMSQILSQLDRAIASLLRGGSVPPSPQLGGRKDGAAAAVARFCAPSSAGSGVWHGNGGAGTTGALLEEMEQRQRRVRGQVKPVERMLGRQAGVVGGHGVGMGIM